MKTYGERMIFTIVEMEMWREAKRLVEKVRSDGCRCHELARAVHHYISRMFAPAQIIVEDGKVGPVEHTWLRVAPTGNVLDVYRPGCMPSVLLLDSIVAGDYKLGVPRIDIRGSSVNQLIHEMDSIPRR